MKKTTEFIGRYPVFFTAFFLILAALFYNRAAVTENVKLREELLTLKKQYTEIVAEQEADIELAKQGLAAAQLESKKQTDEFEDYSSETVVFGERTKELLKLFREKAHQHQVAMSSMNIQWEYIEEITEFLRLARDDKKLSGYKKRIDDMLDASVELGKTLQQLRPR